MSDFLEFLNTADRVMLEQTSGVSAALAERIIAARPFLSVEDSQRVSGLGEKMIERLQESFAREPVLSQDAALAPLPLVVDEQTPASEMPRQTPVQKQKPDFGQRLGRAFVRFLKFLFTLFVVLAILAGIGAAIYFGLPYLYDTYVVPVNRNTARIQEVANQQTQDVAALKSEIAALQTRIADVEQQLTSLETTIEAHTVALAKLEEMQTSLNETAGKQREGLQAELTRQITLTRAIEILSRGRLYLSQSNFGQARLDVQSARDLLVGLQAEFPEDQQPVLATVVSRLDLALGNLPAFPVIAVDDLDIAWQLLVSGLPEDAVLVYPAPTVIP